jgi:hypothetical protein
MRIYLADKRKYVHATFEEVMQILMKNGESKLTCLHKTK